jgi:signal transduction histidine kinase
VDPGPSDPRPSDTPGAGPGGTAGRDLAHEFHNLLGVATGYVDLACERVGPGDAKTVAYLQRALESLARASELAERLRGMTTPPA